MSPAPDIAIIVTAHHEGRAIVPTIRSLNRTIAHALPLAVEVLIVRDRSDSSTIATIDGLLAAGALDHASTATVIDVENGDLSASRNDGIKATSADLVGILDADNLPSENWLSVAHSRFSEADAPLVVHPEFIVTFGAKRELWPLIASDAPQFNAGWLAWYNTWDAFVLARRQVFETHPYRPSNPGSGFGPEDWAWNCDTIAAGVPHAVAQGTTLFYRATEHGLAAAHGASLLPRTDLLRDKRLARAALDRFAAPAPPVRRTFRERSRMMSRTWRAAAYLTRPIRVRMQRTRAPEPISRDLINRRDDWEALHHLQPMLPFPSDDVLRGYGLWGTEWDSTFIPEQRAYWSAIATLPESIDVLVIAPWMRTGGADLLTRQYIESVRRSRPGARIAMITTEPQGSTRLDADGDVAVFDLGAFRLLPQFGVRVLGTLVAQLQPATLHVVNSTLGFDVLDRYGSALAQYTHLFASTFVIDQLPDGTAWSFLHHRSRDFYTSISAVLTDNVQLVNHMVETEGAPRDAFVVHHAAVNETFTPIEARAVTADAPLRIVWAGRFDRQKRLDRLADLAETMRDEPVEIHFYGDAVIDDDADLPATLSRLDQAGAIRHPAYRGGFTEVVASGAEVLILTSDREGVPNTVLEAMSSGIVVVAPDVGDISRVVTPSTGYLVPEADDVAAYAAAVSQILSDRDDAARRSAAARALVEREYSAAALDEKLESVPGYLPMPMGGRGSAYRWFASAETVELLESSQPIVLVYTGSNGHSNFGDILQNKNILHYWSLRHDRVPVLFLPAFAAEDAARITRLRDWFRCEHIVFFAPQRVSCPPTLVEVAPTSTNAPVHVVGGGYLNARWGSDHFDAIDAIAGAFAASQVFFTGLQVDEGARVGFEALVDRHKVPFIGLRDRVSYDLVEAWGLAPVVDTFDDLTEVLEDWARDAPISVESTAIEDNRRRPRVALHMNTSDYAGGDQALRTWREALRCVAALEPSEILLLSAYADARPEVRDTLGTVAALAEEFPFAKVTLIDTAKASLQSEPGALLPKEMESLRHADFALSSSYHTALMMSFLGVPAYLMGANEYFSQKAQLFQLPSLDEFLKDPDLYRLDLESHRATRRLWLERLDAVSFDD